GPNSSTACAPAVRRTQARRGVSRNAHEVSSHGSRELGESGGRARCRGGRQSGHVRRPRDLTLVWERGGGGGVVAEGGRARNSGPGGHRARPAVRGQTRCRRTSFAP